MPKKPEYVPGSILEAALNPNRMTRKEIAEQAGWEIRHHIGAGFRAVRNDAATDADVTPYCPTEDEAWEAAFEMTPRKRYLVWLQNARFEGFVLDDEADLQVFLQGYTTIEPVRGSTGPSSLAVEMREWFESDDVREVIVQEFEINADGFGFTVTSMRREKIVFADDDDEDDSELDRDDPDGGTLGSSFGDDDPPDSYDDHCSKV